MSKQQQHVFELNNSDDEDFLDFHYEPKEEPVKGRGKGKSTVPPASRQSERPIIVRPTTVSTRTHRKVTPEVDPITNYYQHPDDPSIGETVYARDEPTSEKAKKIPLKSVQEHQLLINQLNGYASSVRFKPVLEECGIRLNNLGTKSVAELRELKARAQACCANTMGTAGFVATGTLSVCGVVEGACPKRLADLEGYKAAVEADPSFAAICELIELDSGFKASMTPMQQMAWCLGNTAVQVAAANSAKNKAKLASQDMLQALIAQRNAQQIQQQTYQMPVAAPPPQAAPVASSSAAPVRNDPYTWRPGQ